MAAERPTDLEACAFTDCPLPPYCPMCETCLYHCAGTTTWWRALVYFVRFWWSLGSWRARQGGWYVRL
jgi:hypothetical protein